MSAATLCKQFQAFVSSRSRAHDPSYVNTITRTLQDSPPPDFRGGLLADQMGLGKSLTMISVIAANPARYLDYTSPFTPSPLDLDHHLYPIKTTLLVVPLACEYILLF
jgi:SWI/SNF-related matrix-associated actin-dependent regulator of chromatin subfamily A3